MRKVIFGGAALIALLSIGTGCSREPTISDTGYVGTWARGKETARSLVSIVDDGAGGYLFRWRLQSDDGRRKVQCDWSGYCEELSDGELTAEHWFETSVDPESRRLILNIRVKYHGEEPREDRFVEEMVVRRNGTRVRAIRRRHNDQVLEGRSSPRWDFDKVSDEVEDPPDLPLETRSR